jgi:peptidyl-prolyl cis-trans isomerase C
MNKLKQHLSPGGSVADQDEKERRRGFMNTSPLKNHSRFCSGVFLFAGWMFFVVACQQSTVEQQVIVRVGDERLTLNELLDEIPPAMRSQISREDLQDYLARWINSQILYQEAKRRQLDTQIDIQRELRKLEIDLVANALLDQELDKPLAISDEEIRRYYETNRNSFVRTAPEIMAQHVQCADAATADSLYRLLLGGADFVQTASRLAAKGSDTTSWQSYFSEDETTPEIADQIFRLPVGTISKPVQSDFGYHIFKILNRFPKDTIRELGQVRSQLIAKLEVEKRQARYRQLLTDLKSNTIVETNLAMLDNVKLDSLFAHRGKSK